MTDNFVPGSITDNITHLDIGSLVLPMSTHDGSSFPVPDTLFGRGHRVSRSPFRLFVPSFLRSGRSSPRSFVPVLRPFVPYSQIHHMINLSDYPLTDSQKEILNKGLKLCLTKGQPHMSDLSCIQCYFNKKDKNNETGPSIGPFSDIKSLKVKSNSKWSPPMALTI